VRRAKYQIWRRLALLAGAGVAASAANAQDIATEESAEEVIIVTASKRAATLIDTPISVSVSTAAQIEQSQIRDALDLQTLVPSLRVNQLQASSQVNFSIRGFGNGANNPGIEPSVGVFIDGVYRSRSAAQIGDLPALERVEVLRGPQSTLFGKNASAGIISVVTAAPQFDLGGSAELSYGNFNAVVARGYVTGPISDRLAVSLAANLNKRDGYAFDVNLNEPASNRDRWGVRGQLLFQASESFKARLILDYDKIDENCCAVGNVVNGPTGAVVFALGGRFDRQNPFSFRVFNNIPSTNEIENYGVSLQTDSAAGAFDITTISAYRAVRSNTNQDSDFSSADLLGTNSNLVDIDTFTFEARIASNFDGIFNFLLGGFYFHENINTENATLYGKDLRNYLALATTDPATGRSGYLDAEAALAPLLGFPIGTFGAAGQGQREQWDYKNRAFSIFGQADFAFTDSLTLTGGFNYTQDRKNVAVTGGSTDVFSSLDFVALGGALLAMDPRIPPAQIPTLAQNPAFNPLLRLQPLQFLPPFLGFPNAVEDGRSRDNDLSYTVRLAYKFDERISGYLTYATGFKASSWNLSFGSRPSRADFIPGSPITNPPPSPIRTAGLALPNLTAGSRLARPEESEVFEAGLKGQFDGFGFNLAIFKQSLKGFQSNIFTGSNFILGNADKQSTFGIELDTVFTPVRDLNLTANFTYLDPLFDSFPDGTVLGPNFETLPADLTGKRPGGIPEFSLAIGATYTQRFSDTTRLIWHVDYALESRVDIADGRPDITREVESLNAALTLGLGDHVEFTLWGRNLSNAQYLYAVAPTPVQPGSLLGYPSQPRTYGGLIRYRF
jgi:outer membrane receptor protein involved in Fe transport